MIIAQGCDICLCENNKYQKIFFNGFIILDQILLYTLHPYNNNGNRFSSHFVFLSHKDIGSSQICNIPQVELLSRYRFTFIFKLLWHQSEAELVVGDHSSRFQKLSHLTYDYHRG
jgi:hypothetical protein